ncbi:transcription elongation factor SPT6 homolog [Vicia villosa]|uniref:transcription elongation factor SPT6 homolog n=1 Tax=Vicia villosa TaxID=3911 RepID=UPI00273ADCD6|nr:transcription elongation factor SPT6 homolog [Vicia villosa]
MSHFIVDEEEEEVDENGAPERTKKPKGVRRPMAPGVSSSSLQEAHELFGDVDELLLARNHIRGSNDYKETRLEDEFEPIVLSDKYMTENDHRIRDLDIPERMQISEESTGAPSLDGSSIDEEGRWIVTQLKNGEVPWIHKKDSREELPIDKDDIVRFLELHHVQKLDIPFIAMYRKEKCLSLLKDLEQLEAGDDNFDMNNKTPTLKWHKILWALQDLDKKWLCLQKRKSALQLYYNKRFGEESRCVYDETRLNLNRKLFDSVMRSLKEAESKREVDDAVSMFNLHFPPGEASVDEGQYRRPKRKSMYSTFSKAGLGEVASRFGCSSEQIGLCLSVVQLHELEDPKETPQELASNFTSAMYDTPEKVLKCARHMAAVEITCEPSIKKHVRRCFIDHAVVSTSPTADGNMTIDSFHQFSGVKWLREKPLFKFEDAQWLLIQKAEEDKLIQVTIKLPDEYLNKLIDQFKEYYVSDSVSRSAQMWNEQRKLILHDAIFQFLLPSMEKEARVVLANKAKHWVLMEYGKALWNKVSVGPYQQQKENDLTLDDVAAPRVMACSWGPGKPQTTFVMLDSSGEVQDVLHTGSLTQRSQNVHDQQRKKSDEKRVLKFMTDHQPHVVVLGAANLSCPRLKEDIYEVIFKMVEENPRDVGHEMDRLSIVYGDESLPRLYENSLISSEQLPSQQLGIVRRAVALGRYLQNPLAMVATLCGPRKEILSWKLSPLESFLNLDDKIGMVEQVMVDVTNQVGLDINLATSHEWLFAPLQFISGLGPRKAASLQRSLVRAGSVYTRKNFLTEHQLGKKVFVNSVGFLRVRQSGLAASSSQFFDLLDDTRIHPESYILAQELAKDLYKEDGTGDATDDDDALEVAIEHVRDRPSYLKNLDVEEYAVGKLRQDKIKTFYDIKRELIQGFQDWRKQYEEPSQDEEFYMISGETEETLAEGKVVQVTVHRVQAEKAICRLESGMTGILMKEDFADDWRDIIELSNRLHEGDILTCKIKSIQKNRYQAFLLFKESGMRSDRVHNNHNFDPYYHEEQSSLPSEQDKTQKQKDAKKHFNARMIVHPRFHNLTADEATKFLSDKDPGESIFHPSSLGPSYLTLTLKIHDGVYAHKDIVEGGKKLKDITSLLRIGNTLKIEDDTFEDLDEVIDRYIDPLVTHLKTMLNYRKFRTGTETKVEELLRIEKAEYPMRIVYSFGISLKHPGTFILTYIRSTNPHHEYIGLYPKGFMFRKKMFKDIDRLVAYFQRHVDDRKNDSVASVKSVAAMVPIRSSATGCSSGASVGSGWGGSNSKCGSRTGRPDYRNNGNRDERPSGMPRPYGCGSYNSSSRGHSNHGATRWGSAIKDRDDSLSNFPGLRFKIPLVVGELDSRKLLKVDALETGSNDMNFFLTRTFSGPFIIT